MSRTPVRIDLSPDEPEGRFHRFGLIQWWDQSRLTRAKVLVIGAGALGNELVKNLALLGIGQLFIADLDRVENSNLSRSVLFREMDQGRPKSEVAGEAAKAIYPAIRVQPFIGNAIHSLGLGVFRWADVVLGGLDNREARLAINRNCWKVNRPWIDGAIEQIQGCARVFVPDGPCYECTMSEIDWQLLQRRRSCNLLTRQEMERGRTPTTPTISSIIAGVQCQEAVKLLHGLPTISGSGWVFDGLSTEGFRTEYQRKDECYSHETLEQVVELPHTSNSVTFAELLKLAKHALGPRAQLELARDMVERFHCPACKQDESVFAPITSLRAEQAVCRNCNRQREPVMFYRLPMEGALLQRTPAQMGLPSFDIIYARIGDRLIGFEISGDSSEALGPVETGGSGETP